MELALLKTGGGVDTSELTATENDVVSPYTFYGKDDEAKDTGGVTNKGKKTHTLAANGTYAVEEGYYESITVNQSLATYAGATVNPGKNAVVLPTKNKYVTGNVVLNSIKNLIPSNIKKGEYVGGVGPGTWEGYVNVDPLTPYYYGAFNGIQSITAILYIQAGGGTPAVELEKDAIFLETHNLITRGIVFDEPIDITDLKKLTLTVNAAFDTRTPRWQVIIAENKYDKWMVDQTGEPTYELGEVYYSHKFNDSSEEHFAGDKELDISDAEGRGYLYIGVGTYAEFRIHAVRFSK